MFVKRLRYAFFILACTGSLNAVADGMYKFGYVDSERVYRESHTAKKIEMDLQNEFRGQQQHLLALQENALKLREKLADGRFGTAEKRRAANRLAEVLRQHRIQSARLSEAYNLRRNEEFAAMQRTTHDIVRHIGSSEKFDIIVNDAVYVNSRFDLTDRVIKQLDAEMQQ